MDLGSRRSRGSISSLPGFSIRSLCSSAASLGLRQVASTLHWGLASSCLTTSRPMPLDAPAVPHPGCQTLIQDDD